MAAAREQAGRMEQWQRRKRAERGHADMTVMRGRVPDLPESGEAAFCGEATPSCGDLLCGLRRGHVGRCDFTRQAPRGA